MGLSWVSHSTLIYTTELILCSHIWVCKKTDYYALRDPQETKIIFTTFEWRKVKQSFINLDDRILFAASAKNFEIFRLEYFYLIYNFFFLPGGQDISSLALCSCQNHWWMLKGILHTCEPWNSRQEPLSMCNGTMRENIVPGRKCLPEVPSDHEMMKQLTVFHNRQSSSSSLISFL